MIGPTLAHYQIRKKIGYGYDLVSRWMKVPWNSLDSVFGRATGGSQNAQKFDKKVGFFVYVRKHGLTGLIATDG